MLRGLRPRPPLRPFGRSCHPKYTVLSFHYATMRPFHLAPFISGVEFGPVLCRDKAFSNSDPVEPPFLTPSLIQLFLNTVAIKVALAAPKEDAKKDQLIFATAPSCFFVQEPGTCYSDRIYGRSPQNFSPIRSQCKTVTCVNAFFLFPLSFTPDTSSSMETSLAPISGGGQRDNGNNRPLTSRTTTLPFRTRSGTSL